MGRDVGHDAPDVGKARWKRVYLAGYVRCLILQTQTDISSCIIARVSRVDERPSETHGAGERAATLVDSTAR